MKIASLALAILCSAAVLAPDFASAAPVCTRSDVRQFQSLLKRVDAAGRTFENSRIKDWCRAGRRLIGEFHRAERTIKSRPKCALATARDRRDFAKLQRVIRTAERALKSGC
jgi:hypothetical protein